jgi:hypothetical protein
MLGHSSGDAAAQWSAGRLPLPAVCGGGCRERWKVPTSPYFWLTPLLLPSLFWVLVALGGLVSGPTAIIDRGRWLTYVVTMVLLAAMCAIPAVLWVRRLHRYRCEVLAGQRVPVTVYYGRMPRAAFPVVPDPRLRYLSTARVGDLFTQPLLLLAAADGRLWTALPDVTNIKARYAAWGNGTNPWIAPLLTPYDDGQTVVDPGAARGRRLPVDLGAAENRRVLEALRHLGQPELDDPPEAAGVDLYRNDPRTFGGPVPGELLLAPGGRYNGLVLHRPADAPVSVPLAKRYGTVEYYYFGADPGLCRGFYLKELTPLA